MSDEDAVRDAYRTFFDAALAGDEETCAELIAPGGSQEEGYSADEEMAEVDPALSRGRVCGTLVEPQFAQDLIEARAERLDEAKVTVKGDTATLTLPDDEELVPEGAVRDYTFSRVNGTWKLKGTGDGEPRSIGE